VTVSGSPDWELDQFVAEGGTEQQAYYVLIGRHLSASSPKEGSDYAITANGPNTLQLDTNGEDISNIAVGTKVSVFPHWTLDSLFPASRAGISFTPSESTFARKTEVFIPDFQATGINAAPAEGFFFFDGGWRRIGRPITENHGGTILLPSGYFIVRNKPAATGGVLTATGRVPGTKIRVPLATQASGNQDNPLSFLRPVPVTLNQSGLVTSGAFASSDSTFNRRDELFVYGRTTGFNPAASATYFFHNNGWRKVGQPITEDFGDDLIDVGSGFIVRKAATAGGVTHFWTHDKTYP
jgi:uncharacterized protein (TIGR02597 family)